MDRWHYITESPLSDNTDRMSTGRGSHGARGGQSTGGGLRRLPPSPRRHSHGGVGLLPSPRESAPQVSSSSIGAIASGSNVGGGLQNKSHIVVPLHTLSESERAVVPATTRFHGVVRNDVGVFVVFNAHRGMLERIPHPPTAYSRPLYPIFDADLLRPLKLSIRAIPMERGGGESRWSLANHLLEQWMCLENILAEVLRHLQQQVRTHNTVADNGDFHAWPKSFGYMDSFFAESQLVSAVSRSRDAFVSLISAIVFTFIALDSSQERLKWRTALQLRLDLSMRFMDSLEDVVERSLQDPAGMILDCTSQSPRPLDWLFSLLVNDTVGVHPPLLFFLGEGSAAVNRASWLEDFPSMRNVRLAVKDAISVFTLLPPTPVATQEYVFVNSSMRFFGALPNPDFYAALTKKPEYPPVERLSGQKDGEDYETFFSRREERDQRKMAEESPSQRQIRLQREEVAGRHILPGRKGARVYIWEDVNGFWIRRLVSRKDVEDVWDDFAPSQRVYNGFANEWDLCTPLDPDAEAEDDFEEYDLETYQYCAPVLPSALENDTPCIGSTVGQESKQAVQLRLEAPYEDGGVQYSPDNAFITDDIHHSLEYRLGLIDNSGGTYSEAQMLRSDVCAHFLGDSTRTPSNAARALLLKLKSAKTVADMPSDLFDLSDQERAEELWSRAGIRIDLIQGVSERAHRSTANLLQPRERCSNTRGRQIVVFSAATALDLVRRRCSSWSEIVSQLHDLGAPFNIVVEELSCAPSFYRPELLRCPSLGIRPEGYVPDEYDLRVYWDLAKRFLLSPRGRLALQAGGVVARIARLIIEDSELELRCDDVDVASAHDKIDLGSTSLYYHTLTSQEVDLILGVYRIEMDQLNPLTRTGHQEARVSWWPQVGAFFSSGLNVGWWTPECERWFRRVLRDMDENKAIVLNNTRWKDRIRGYSAALGLAKRLDAVYADYLDRKGNEDS